MDLSLNEDQEMLKKTAREFIQKECPKELLLEVDKGDTSGLSEIWRNMSELGWMGIIVPQEYGGEGSSLTDAAVLYQELGRGPVPGPLFSSSVLGSMVLLTGGTDEQKSSVLPELASGREVLGIAITEEDYRWDNQGIQMAATAKNGGYVLNGLKLFVQDAPSATRFLCAARIGPQGGRAGDISLFLVDAASKGITMRELPGFVTSVAEVKFDSVEVTGPQLLGEAGSGWSILEEASQRALPILCAYCVGGCEAVYEMSVAYSQTRIQFGQPIGRFQRVQDHIIEQVNHLDAARWTTYEAVWKLDSGKDTNGSVYLAKALAAEAYYQACNRAHEVHAGVGVMTEYGLTLHTKMSRSLYHYLGDPRYHKRKLADALDL